MTEPGTKREDVKPERRDAAQHRRQILDVARALFAEHGVAAVSMHQIALAAKVGQGTLYRRFAHKGMLCIALLAENTERAQQQFREYLQTTQDLPLVRLEALFNELLRFNEENAQLLAALLDAATGERRTSTYNNPNPFYGWLHQTIIILLTEAIEQKEIAPLDIEYSANTLLAPFTIDLYLYQRYELKFTAERISNGAKRLLFDGLRLRT